MANVPNSVVEEDLPGDVGKGIPVRLGCGVILISTILCSVFLLGIINLIATGEINISRGDLEGYRLWLIRDDGLRGLGVSSSGEVDRNGTPGLKCIRTKVKFLEWRPNGEGDDTEYCECYQSEGGDWVYISACPE